MNLNLKFFLGNVGTTSSRLTRSESIRLVISAQLCTGLRKYTPSKQSFVFRQGLEYKKTIYDTTARTAEQTRMGRHSSPKSPAAAVLGSPTFTDCCEKKRGNLAQLCRDALLSSNSKWAHIVLKMTHLVRYSGFLPQSRSMHGVRLTGNAKLAAGVNGCLAQCVSPATDYVGSGPLTA